MDINQLLRKTIELNGSDLHLASNQKPWVRVDGVLEVVDDHSVITREELHDSLIGCMSDYSRDIFEKRWDVDFAYIIDGDNRFRANVFNTTSGIAAAFRPIPTDLFSLDDLRMPSILKTIVMKKRGLVLVTGPTGCGKSTTLASMIDYINDNKSDHIVTIEDPIEYLHSSKKCLINQREVHFNTKNFNIALRSALREDPDIILVGEMRDLETIRLVLTAAETGHLVFATLHTMSAVKSIARMIDVFPGSEQALIRTMLSESLVAVLSQVLVKKNTKYGGRVAATELMICNSAIRNLIRENKLSQAYSVLQTGSEHGMYTLDQNIVSLLKQGIISLDTAKSVANDKSVFS